MPHFDVREEKGGQLPHVASGTARPPSEELSAVLSPGDGPIGPDHGARRYPGDELEVPDPGPSAPGSVDDHDASIHRCMATGATQQRGHAVEREDIRRTHDDRAIGE